jgi:SET domain-containing protein
METIAIVNSLIKIKLQPSKVHGIGVFAMRDIEKGVKLYSDIFPQAFKIPYEDFDKLFPEVEEYILTHWPLVVTGSAFMWPDVKFQAFMNHSDKPNYDAKNDITLKKIKAGEEIFEDYRKIESWKEAFAWKTFIDIENKV